MTTNEDVAAAERPQDRLQRRTRQRNRKQRNRRQANQNTNQGSGGGGGGGGNGNRGGNSGTGGNQAPAPVLGTTTCDVCARGCRFSDLQAAIDDPSNLLTITFCDVSYSGMLSISRSVTVQAGSGWRPMLQGLASFEMPVVQLADGDYAVTLVGLDLVTGNTGIAVNGSPTLTLRDCRIYSNTNQTTNGGGIVNDSGTLALYGCTITQNSTLALGGGIFNQAGHLLLDGTSITGNSAAGNGANVGGGIYSQGGTVTLQNGSSVSGNVSDDCVQGTPGVFHGSGCASILTA